MQRIATLILLLWGATLALSAQSTPVVVAVVDSSDRSPVPGAVLVFNDSIRLVSDGDGRSSATLHGSVASYRITAMGYAPAVGNLVLADGMGVRTLYLHAAHAELDAVVVSAGRHEQRVGTVAGSLSVLRKELLRDKNVADLGQALEQTPGVVVVDNEPQIRAGSGFSYGAGSRVMMLIDDLPILSGDIGRPSWTYLPVETTDRIEVIKGASSVLYGSAALSGAINVRTSYPTDMPRTRATVFGGVYDTPGAGIAPWWKGGPPLFTGANFSHAQRYGRFDLVVGGHAFADDGHIGPERMHPDSLAASPYATRPPAHENRVRMNVATRWHHKRLRTLSYGINANVMKSHAASVFLWDGPGEGLFRPEPGTVTTTAGTQFHVDPHLEYLSNKGTRHRLRARLYHQDFANDNAQSNANEMLYGEYVAQQRMPWWKGVMLVAGASAQRVWSRAELYRGNGTGDGRNNALNLATYLQADAQLTDRWHVNLGGRYESFSVNGHEEGTPVFRGGMVFRATKTTYLRGSFGQGFRYPTIGERYIRTAVGMLRIYPNPDLRPERSTNAELGVRQGFRFGRFQGYLDMAVYDQRYEDYVEFTFGIWEQPTLQNLLGLGFRSVNTGGARITGAEVSATATGQVGPVGVDLLLGWNRSLPVSTTPHQVYANASAFGSNANYTYANTSSDTTGNILKFRVQELVRADVGLRWKRFSVGYSLRYNSHVRNIDKVFLDLDRAAPPLQLSTGVAAWMEERKSGDLIMDARCGFALTPQVKVAFIVNNLANTVYATRPLAIEAPRSWQVQLIYER